MRVKEFKDRFAEIEEQVDETDLTELEEKVSVLIEEISDWIGMGSPEEDTALRKLLRKINHFKKENDFYDSEAELDRMFPDSDDDDFDEESMSFDSVFGDK